MYFSQNLTFSMCKWYSFVGFSCTRECGNEHIKFDDITDPEDKRKIEQFIVQQNGAMWVDQRCITVLRENNNLVGNMMGPFNSGT